VRALRSDVAALYVDPRGPYPKLLEQWWDEKRDARTYAGPWPVVAHPPCGPWCAFSHLCKLQDPELAPLAFEQVRRHGGVLEHPAGSGAFRCARPTSAPFPGELPDEYGGRTIEVDQLWWGHSCRKKTWLYLVHVDLSYCGEPPPFPNAKPTHDLMGSRGKNAKAKRAGKREASQEMRRRTPPAFAEWLISLAATAKRPA
jgi:hypothetical protein